MLASGLWWCCHPWWSNGAWGQMRWDVQPQGSMVGQPGAPKCLAGHFFPILGLALSTIILPNWHFMSEHFGLRMALATGYHRWRPKMFWKMPQKETTCWNQAKVSLWQINSCTINKILQAYSSRVKFLWNDTSISQPKTTGCARNSNESMHLISHILLRNFVCST